MLMDCAGASKQPLAVVYRNEAPALLLRPAERPSPGLRALPATDYPSGVRAWPSNLLRSRFIGQPAIPGQRVEQLEVGVRACGAFGAHLPQRGSGVCVSVHAALSARKGAALGRWTDGFRPITQKRPAHVGTNTRARRCASAPRQSRWHVGGWTLSGNSEARQE